MALPTKITLEIVTPDRSLVREDVDEVIVPGSEGEFGILPGHTPLLATLRVGELSYRQGQEKHYLAIAFGFAEAGDKLGAARQPRGRVALRRARVHRAPVALPRRLGARRAARRRPAHRDSRVQT